MNPDVMFFFNFFRWIENENNKYKVKKVRNGKNALLSFCDI